MQIGIITAIYSSLTLGLAYGALKNSYRSFPPSVAFFLDALFGLIIWLPLSILFGVKLIFLPASFIYALISAILSEALVFYALSKGKLAITNMIVGSYPIYTIIFSFLINGERLNLYQTIFISLTILGTVIISFPPKRDIKKLKKKKYRSEIIWPIIAAVAIGLSDTLSKRIINQTQDFSFLFALAIVQIPVAWIYLKIEKQNLQKNIKRLLKKPQLYKHAILGSFFNIIGTGLLWISFSFTLASIASPITATSSAMVLLFSITYLDEKLSFNNVLSLLAIFGGIIGVALLG
jgi:drug/metabolite transporter (DMT)-like permease